MVKVGTESIASIKKMIYANSYMNIATVGVDGQPWNTPVFFANQDNQLYWFSSKNSQHSKNIIHNNQVFITIYDSTAPEGDGRGVYIKASALEIHDSQSLEVGIRAYNKKAKKFKINKDFVSSSSPNSLYCAEIIELWINGESEQDGYYIDIRKKAIE